GLLHHGMREAPLDLDDDRLLVLVADDGALQDALWHVHRPYAFLPADFSTAMVLMRAMSLRTCLTRAVFSSWPVAFWKRRLNCSFLRAARSSESWSCVFERSSSTFIFGVLIRRCAVRSACGPTAWRRRGAGPRGRCLPARRRSRT